MFFEERIGGVLVCLGDSSSESASITRRSFHLWRLFWCFFLDEGTRASFFALEVIEKGIRALRVEEETERWVDVQEDRAPEFRVLLED